SQQLINLLFNFSDDKSTHLVECFYHGNKMKKAAALKYDLGFE
ncbi:MAG: hypothetical protein K0R46_2329, partial [Herbinix sp.]|nr:hypothetical protein [Herbinix sp.]